MPPRRSSGWWPPEGGTDSVFAQAAVANAAHIPQGALRTYRAIETATAGTLLVRDQSGPGLPAASADASQRLASWKGAWPRQPRGHPAAATGPRP